MGAGSSRGLLSHGEGARDGLGNEEDNALTPLRRGGGRNERGMEGQRRVRLSGEMGREKKVSGARRLRNSKSIRAQALVVSQKAGRRSVGQRGRVRGSTEKGVEESRRCVGWR